MQMKVVMTAVLWAAVMVALLVGFEAEAMALKMAGMVDLMVERKVD